MAATKKATTKVVKEAPDKAAEAAEAAESADQAQEATTSEAQVQDPQAAQAQAQAQEKKTEALKAEAPKTEAPKTEAPKTDEHKPEEPEGPTTQQAADDETTTDETTTDETGSGQATPDDAVAVPEEPVDAELEAALVALRDRVGGVGFGLDVAGIDDARRAQREIVAQLDDYVLPRVRTSAAPLLVVVAGSTGAGKSTLVNSLVGEKVSATGVRRPTTSNPVLACHPDDRRWFADTGLLPGFRRVEEPGLEDGDELVIAAVEGLPRGLAILDTPDIDSAVEEHHETAHKLLSAADLWLVVTTAARYADAPAWRLLRLAKDRDARLAILLSRVPEGAEDSIDGHLGEMLEENGMAGVERFVAHETTVVGGRLPDGEVEKLRGWLAELVADDDQRAEVATSSLGGVLDSFRTRVPELAKYLEAQVAVRGELREDVEAAYSGALDEVDEATRNGSLLRGEVLARWQDFASTGELMRALHVRRAGGSSFRKRRAPARERALKMALRNGIESVIISAAHRAAEDVLTRWRQRSAGEALVAGVNASPSAELARRAARAIGAWQEHLVELIRTEGITKRLAARFVSFDEESLALVFTIGLVGYGTSEVSVGAGTSAVPQRLLRGLFGAESLRGISGKARSDLRARISVLFDEETSVYGHALDAAGVPDETAPMKLYQAMYNLEVAR